MTLMHHRQALPAAANQVERSDIMKKIDRRTFLMGSAATIALSAAPIYLSFNEFQKASAQSEVEQIPTYCQGCTSYCGLIAFVKNDRLWKIKGHPIHLKSEGHLCARGHGMAKYLYSPDRITGPMKRVSDNQFEAISWEQAFKEIGTQLNDIVAKHSGNSVVWMEHGTTRKHYVDRLFDTIGSPNFVTQYAACFNAKTNAWQHMVGTMLNGDHENAKYMIFQGRNFAGGIIPNGMTRILRAKEQGAKIICIDPRFTEFAKISDEWVPIRPGTDLAFRLAMAHVLITERLYNSGFVNKYVDGFDEFWRYNKDCTPEWAETITDVPADKIREIARDFAKFAPTAFIDPGWHGLHAHFKNSTQTAQMAIILNALVGNFYEKGGLMPAAGVPFGSLNLPQIDGPEKGDRVDGAGVDGQYKTVEPGRGIAHIISSLAAEGKVKAAFVCNYNPLRTAPDPREQVKLREADLVVSINIDWNETSYHAADYILPEHYYLERFETPMAVSGQLAHPHPQVALRQPVVTPLYDTKNIIEILDGIAKAMGYPDLYPFTIEEEIKANIAPLGISFDRLKAAGTIQFPATIKPGFPTTNGRPSLTTPTGKIQFSAEIFKLNGRIGVPTWIPPLVMPDPNKIDEFRLIHGKQPWHSHAMTNNNEYLMAISKRYYGTFMWMNTARAKALNIKTGDTVTVKSPIATKKAQIHVTELIHPDCVWVPSTYGGYSPKNKIAYGVGINFNDFVPVQVEDYSGTTMAEEIIVSIEKEVK